MLEDLPFTGTMRVVNKGVDAALVVRPAYTEAALRAAKRCGVRGVSTAVLEAADPPDLRTLEYFCTLTGKLAFSDRALLEAHAVPAGTSIWVAEGETEADFSNAVMSLQRLPEGQPFLSGKEKG